MNIISIIDYQIVELFVYGFWNLSSTKLNLF